LHALPSGNVPTIADRIHERRLELGLSQREAACKGVSAAHLCRLERGDRSPSGKALRSIAARFSVSVHWLETGEADPAEELARLVLEYKGRPLPTRARGLAQAVLESSSG
jgi:transcriptional regulator with XRE-family HTH domain